MSAKAVREQFGKELLFANLNTDCLVKCEPCLINQHDIWDDVTGKFSWIAKASKVVIKPDQLIKRRGKLGLVFVGSPAQAKEWFEKHKGTKVKVDKTEGTLKNFIIEPFVEFAQKDEMYLAMFSQRDRDVIMFHHQGGVDIGDVDAKAQRISIPVQLDDAKMVPSDADLSTNLLKHVDGAAKKALLNFIPALYQIYKDLYFTYLEINPLVVKNDKVYILDLAAKLDETAYFVCSEKWKTRTGEKVDFPPPFGRDLLQEEQYIADLDAKTGASLKLTILNREGRIWTMVAGGGASVIFTDTVCDMEGASELANYGEYSGDPNETQTYEYAKTIVGLMTEGTPHPKGKVLIIGGSIANFTNVAKTFKGIVRALEEFKLKLQEHNVTIYVRRGGPNYQEGLRKMKSVGASLGVPLHVYGPETHMTAVVGASLGKKEMPPPAAPAQTTGHFLLPGSGVAAAPDEQGPAAKRPRLVDRVEQFINLSRRLSLNQIKSFLPNITETPVSESPVVSRKPTPQMNGPLKGLVESLFENDTQAVVWGQQQKAIQGMLDFDFVCNRAKPSVVAATYPLGGDHKQKYYFGHKEILLPVYKHMRDCMEKHKNASVLVSFASLRSVYETTLEAMHFPQIRTIALIAEGVPENQTRKILKLAAEKGITIIGPATVGGIKPGCFKIGNTGGMMDNILASRLYRSGSVGYVSRSGGMSNELNNIIGQNTDGVFEGVAIGGDRYPGSTYLDHLKRYQNDDRVKMLVLLGEVGGQLEYDVIEAIRNKEISKPMVAWCIGTCADHITSEVQFGHAGASAHAKAETAASKNAAFREVGVTVPNSFDDLGTVIKEAFDKLVKQGLIEPREDHPPPAVPMDYAWARELGLIRKPASFMTSICDERGEELLYAGTPISKVLEQDMGIGGVLGLLWFQRKLPPYAHKFIEMCLILTADHGPAVSGAHNTIICARAGKDLISSLVSGLLTIGDRFGGALDGAAKMFSEAYDAGLSPMEFVNKMRKEGKLIAGIGHRVKSINNPDKRVEILKNFALDRSEFQQETKLLDYAIEVEKVTTTKKPNLILNVDGAIGVIFVDIMRDSGCFTAQEGREMIEIGALNGLFVLGRSLGFIGHYLDQKRLKQGLYRHPWDDITYLMPEYGLGETA